MRRTTVRSQLRTLTLAFLSVWAPSIAAKEKPNVVFIAIDDLNDWVGCLKSHPLVKTPHIDRLAARGVLFTNAHCQAPLCNPSRTSLLTGRRPSTTGVYGLSPWFRDVEELKKIVTLPKYFSRRGYRTFATGKVFHRHFGLREQDREFDEVGPKYDDGPFPKKRLAKIPGGRGNDWGVSSAKDEQRGDWKIASWAVAKLNAMPKSPFFLSVGIRLPHLPLFATQRWFDLYPNDATILPPIRRDDRVDTPRFSWYLHWKLPEFRLAQVEAANEWIPLVRAYLACISFLDSQVGRVLDALRKNGFEKNTVVVLASDHGWHLGEKLITGKNTLWERSTRVPLVIAGPGVAVGRSAEPVELLDIYPTLVKLCGLNAKPDLEGHSLVPQLRDPGAKRPWPAITTASQNNHAIRSRDWRYIRYADASEELYHMGRDPNEWENLAGDEAYRSVLAEHRRWLPRTNTDPVPGSRGRVLTVEDGKVIWEGREIQKGSPIPGLGKR
ncbi:MAG: sulfatase [Planctomycetota bacterium]